MMMNETYNMLRCPYCRSIFDFKVMPIEIKRTSF